MSAEATMLIALVSGAVGVLASLAAMRVQWRRDIRDGRAADDREADRVIRLKDERIAELEVRVDGLQRAVDDLREKIRVLEQQVDQYGCWRGPDCEDRWALGGPRPDNVRI